MSATLARGFKIAGQVYIQHFKRQSVAFFEKLCSERLQMRSQFRQGGITLARACKMTPQRSIRVATRVQERYRDNRRCARRGRERQCRDYGKD